MKKLSQILAEFKYGYLDEAAGKELQKATKAALEMGKTSKITIEFTLKPKSDSEIEMTGKFKSDIPRHDSYSTLMFANGEFDLLSNDPRQKTLFESVKVVGKKDETIATA